MSDKKVKDPCLECTEAVVRKTGGVQCNFCEEWAHPKCAKISNQHLNALREQEGMTWTCARCRKVSLKLQKQVNTIYKDVIKLQETVKENTAKIGNNERRIENVEKKVKEVDKKAIVNASMSSMSEENREQENRRNNVIIHQVSEADQNVKDVKERKKHDVDKVIELLTDIGNDATENDIKFIVRLNTRQNENVREKSDGNIRPLLVGFHSSEKKDEVIRDAYTLIQNKSKSSIIPDLTPFQREQEKTMKQKAVELNNEMDDEESLNWEWRLVGLKGQKRLIKARKRTDHVSTSSRARGQGGRMITGHKDTRGKQVTGPSHGEKTTRSRSRGQASEITQADQIQTASLNSSVMLPQEDEDEENALITVSQIPHH